MKSRLIQTQVYQDPEFFDLPLEARWLFIYLLTSPYASLTGAFVIRPEQLALDTGLTIGKVNEAIGQLCSTSLLRYVDKHFVISEKYRTNYNTGMSASAFQKEFSKLPKSVKTLLKEGFDSTIHSTIRSTIHSTHKLKIINNKSKNKNKKLEKKEKNTELQEVYDHYNKVFGRSLGYSDQLEKNFLFWRERYEVEDMKKAIDYAWQDDWWKTRLVPEKLFRQKDPRGENVDRIQSFLAKGGQKNSFKGLKFYGE